ncbi:hypothetical protein Trydic_g15957 [Trypoxylus dichotomus]
MAGFVPQEEENEELLRYRRKFRAFLEIVFLVPRSNRPKEEEEEDMLAFRVERKGSMGPSMLWMAVCSMLLWLTPGTAIYATQRGQAYQISPKPCFVDGMEGTCMFVWECIKSDGYHIGMCVDTFMFGSCCTHNITENTVLPQYVNKPSILYTPPSHHSHVTKRPSTQSWPSTSRPKGTSKPHKPQTINYPPNKDTTYPLLPSISKSTSKPFTSITNSFLQPTSTDSYHISTNALVHKKPGWQFTTEPGFVTQLHHNAIPGVKPAAAPQWSFTTEPSFVTKTKTKPSSFKPKPTKKPLPLTTSKSTIKFSSKPTSLVTPSIIKGTSVYTSTSRPKITTTVPPISSTIPWNQIDKTSTSEASNLVATVPATATGFDTSGCGLPPLFPKPQTRIVGGKNALFGRWPWQVSVRRTSFFGFSSTHRCGGAVLNENWIATAGHCVDDLLTSQIRIRVGEYDFSSVQEELPYVERAVARKIVHPKYNFFTYEYDLALVQLDKSLEFAPHISPICLPASDDLLIGENATVTGWGRLSEGGSLPTVLQEVHVPIVSNDNCKSMFLKAGRHEYIPDIFLCAGYEKGGQDSCQGDSGGPLQVRGKDGRYFLAGIISWGIGCAEANLPGVCTRISKFVPWILKNVT